MKKVLPIIFLMICAAAAFCGGFNAVPLDGEWALTTEEKEPRTLAIEVPGCIVDTVSVGGPVRFTKSFDFPRKSRSARYILRFESVYYRAEVFLNGVSLGSHDGGDAPFEFDATSAIKKGANNLEVRVTRPLGGADNKENELYSPYVPGGSMLPKGGIEDSVSLLIVPVVRPKDVYAEADAKTGGIVVHTDLENLSGKVKEVTVTTTVSMDGAVCDSASETLTVPAGVTESTLTLNVENHKLWNVDTPTLYDVTVKTTVDGNSFVKHSSCGFRDFRFEGGKFLLNGKKIFLRGILTTPYITAGLDAKSGREVLRREITNLKTMGFNTLRFIAYPATRDELNLCDAMGMLVLEEPRASWLLRDRGQLPARYKNDLLNMVRRDRNHPSVVMYGLLNETGVGVHMRAAIDCLPDLRALDRNTMVIMNSGGSDGIGDKAEGFVEKYKSDANGSALFAGGEVMLIPGGSKERTCARYTVPADGKYDITAAFEGKSTAIVPSSCGTFAYLNGEEIFNSNLGFDGGGNRTEYKGVLDLKAGDTLDFAVNYGHWFPDFDSTLNDVVKLTVTGLENPAYGFLDDKGFTAYDSETRRNTFGAYCNPGENDWGMGMADMHHYPGVPHFHWDFDFFRTMNLGGRGILLSEYGVGDGMNYPRAYNLFLMRNYTYAGVKYAATAAKFDNNWYKYGLGSTFANAEDYFAAADREMSKIRYFGTSAIRSCKDMAGHFVTCSRDPDGGDGIFDPFGNPKKDVIDAFNAAWAPVHLACFVSSSHIYKGDEIGLDVTLSHDNDLKPGKYPVKITIFDENNKCVLEKHVEADVTEDFAVHVYTDKIAFDYPAGKYRFEAVIEHGAAAGSMGTYFFVGEPCDFTGVTVSLASPDDKLSEFLTSRGAKIGDVSPDAVLVGENVTPEKVKELYKAAEEGAKVIFLKHSVLVDNPPIKGAFKDLNAWLFTKDDWYLNSPMFAGLPTGIADRIYYRGIISPTVFSAEDDVIAYAGASDNSGGGGGAGVSLGEVRRGRGRIIFTTLGIYNELGKRPPAERLLYNAINL